MYLDKNSLFFGYPASLTRKVFRKLEFGYADEQFFSHHMGINQAEAAILIITCFKTALT